MKILLSLFFITYFSYPIYSQLEKPSDYNNFIVEEQKKVLLKIMEYNIYTIHNDNFEAANVKRLDIIVQLEASIERIKAMFPYNEDAKLRDEASEVFSLYKDAYELEFNDINLLRRERENSFEAMEKYINAQNKAEEKLKIAGDKFIQAQKVFSKKYNMNLIGIDTKNEFDNIVDVNQYSRSIFLEYFRVSKIDADFLDALNNQNAQLMDEKRNKIIQEAEISLNRIKNILPYKDDKVYKDKAIELVRFHVQLANTEYLELVNILKKDKRTQIDIDRYNQVVTEVNINAQKLVSEFNRENKELLKKYIPYE